MKPFGFFVCLFALCFNAACGGCHEDRSFERPQEGLLDKFFKSSAPQSMPVTVANPEMREVSTAPTVPARISSSESVDVKSPGNIRIDQVLVSEGNAVEVGAALARYSEEDLPLKLGQLRAQLKQAEATFEKNSYLLRNREEMYQDGRMDRTQYDNIESQVEANEAEVERLRDAVEHMEERGEQSNITSPIAGVVQSKLAQSGGNYLTDSPLFTLVKTDPLLVEFDLPANYLSLVRANQTLTLLFPDLASERASVVVQNLSSSVNPNTNTFTVKASLANSSGAYKSGLRAEIELPSSQKQFSFFIPTEAILTDRNMHYVYTVIDGVAHQAFIVPKSTQGILTEVSSGLREDDLMVVKGQERLQENTKVDIWGK